jgi:hypothetical protein
MIKETAPPAARPYNARLERTGSRASRALPAAQPPSRWTDER